MQRSARFLAVGLIATIFFGAGCAKKTPPPATPDVRRATSSAPTAPSQNPAVVAFDTGQTADTAINEELTNILRAFREVKSFRMKFDVPSPQGVISTVLEFLKPDRLHGVMKLGKNIPTDVVVVGDSVYMRTDGQRWLDLSGTDAAKTVSTSLKSTLSGNVSLDKIGVDPETIVKKTEDKVRQCMRYKALVKSQDGTPASLEICAMNGLPRYVDITTEKGSFSFEYYDFDALFLIEKPM